MPTEIPYGWREDPDGGLIRDPQQTEERRPRPGIWCKLTGLSTHTDMNDCFVEVIQDDVSNGDKTARCRFGAEEYNVYPRNLIPLEGSEKRASFHADWKDDVSLMVNGINCNACRTSLRGVLLGIEGIGPDDILEIGTKAESGAHPNKVVLRGVTEEQAKAAIATLDAGRGKFTIVDK